MRAVGEVVVKGLIKPRELLGVVIAFKKDDVPRIDFANLRDKPPVEGIHAAPVGLEVRIDVPRIVAETIV
jgi:hypothetical protein